MPGVLPGGPWWSQAVLVAAAVHLGLQLVVHLVVYPALAGASARDPERALHAHQEHMGRMGLAVAPVYGALAVTSVGLVVVAPGPAAVAVLVGVLLTFAVTALVAVPTHQAVLTATDPGRRARLHRRLDRADAARLVLALVVLGLAWSTS